jgi:ParB family chromosome partitioning protein
MNTPFSKRPALGRGLESLLPSRAATPALPEERTGAPIDIPLDQIDRNPFQTRTQFDPEKLKELAQSISASGVVQPIVVRPGANGRFQLIMGERRLQASRQAGKKSIPAVVRQVGDEQALEMTIVENLQRADLNPMEQARAYQRLSTDFHMTQEQMAQRTGKERASVANFLRLLRLPAPIQQQVEAGELSFGHARALLSLPNSDKISAAAQKVVSHHMSVRQTETLIYGLLHPEDKAKQEPKVREPLDPNVREARDIIQRKLGMRVRIEDREGKGRVIIEYAGLKDFDLLMQFLGA